MKKILKIIAFIFVFTVSSYSAVTYTVQDLSLESGGHQVIVKIVIDSSTVSFTPYLANWSTYFFDASTFQNDSIYYVGYKHTGGKKNDSLTLAVIYGSPGPVGTYPFVVDTIQTKDTSYWQTAHTARSSLLFANYWAVGITNIFAQTAGAGTYYFYFTNRAWAKKATPNLF